jgi:type IV pilus assembly protein PilV
MSNTRMQCKARLSFQRGVGIVEVLVAVLVLSIGLLGLAGLQMRTLRNTESSLERGVAVIQTHAIADAMRADRLAAIEAPYQYNIALGDAAPTANSTLAEKILADWRNNLIATLGEDATGSVNCNGALCEIVIQWNDSRGSGDAVALETHTMRTQVQL